MAFAVGVPHVLGTPFNEAMYAPTGPLTVATRAEAVNASSTAGVVGPVTGVGTGETHQASPASPTGLLGLDGGEICRPVSSAAAWRHGEVTGRRRRSEARRGGSARPASAAVAERGAVVVGEDASATVLFAAAIIILLLELPATARPAVITSDMIRADSPYLFHAYVKVDDGQGGGFRDLSNEWYGPGTRAFRTEVLPLYGGASESPYIYAGDGSHVMRSRLRVEGSGAFIRAASVPYWQAGRIAALVLDARRPAPRRCRS